MRIKDWHVKKFEIEVDLGELGVIDADVHIEIDRGEAKLLDITYNDHSIMFLFTEIQRQSVFDDVVAPEIREPEEYERGVGA